MHLILCTQYFYNLVEIPTCNLILKCFQAPAGEVAEDDGEHGKRVTLYLCENQILLGTPI